MRDLLTHHHSTKHQKSSYGRCSFVLSNSVDMAIQRNSCESLDEEKRTREKEQDLLTFHSRETSVENSTDGFLTSIHGTFRSMTSVNPHQFGVKHDMVGVSCWYFALVGVFFAVPAGNYSDALEAILISFFSFNADFARRGTNWDVLDRWFASAAFFHRSYMIFPLIGYVGLACIYISAFLLHTRSRTIQNSEDWVRGHTVWHVGMALIYGWTIHLTN